MMGWPVLGGWEYKYRRVKTPQPLDGQVFIAICKESGELLEAYELAAIFRHIASLLPLEGEMTWKLAVK